MIYYIIVIYIYIFKCDSNRVLSKTHLGLPAGECPLSFKIKNGGSHGCLAGGGLII